MICDEVEDITDLCFLAEVERMEQNELINQKRLAAMQLRTNKENVLINQKRLAAMQLRAEKQNLEIEKYEERQRIEKGKRNYEKRLKYYSERQEAVKKIMAEEAEAVRIADKIERILEDVHITINQVIDEIEMSEAVETIALKMDQEEERKGGVIMLEFVNPHVTKPTKSKRRRNEKIDMGKTRTSVRRKNTK